ncbi:MAG: hypothetical protein U1E13_03975, partial [Methylophilaceae bacterium]|nr:hypothetical protein [Methylophilaceae bacterium]
MRQRVTPTPVSIFAHFASLWASVACLLFVLCLTHGHVVAEESSNDSSQTMTWPLLPGENLNQLAALFYPNTPSMQQVFIKQTLALSQELHPQLTANTAVNELTSIIIPDLKALSKQGSSIEPKPSALKMAHQMGERSIAIVTEAMWREYEALKQSNLLLTQELEKLHARLDKLQATVTKVKEAAQNFIKRQTAQLAKPVEEKKQLPAPVVATAKAEPPIQLAQATTPLPAYTMPPKDSNISWPLSTTGTLLPIGLFGLIVAVFYGLSRRRYKYISDDLGPNEIKPIDWPATEINPASENAEETL